ncbi:L,D-transpeptidase family protein [Sphingomonas sp. IC-56]|uniref:L,D-transpeptidase family protein n=1 Tax=Sphingomonas sp. IC-56 TaxID=2898529 RepID=UPI001E65BBE5|nr:L,D-transpeptidase family protein [Sphingomonas sp. IC-56]MCD2325480.1 L,D-transpeptidase family protein [Sphingomonas sp. IC-56]
MSMRHLFIAALAATAPMLAASPAAASEVAGEAQGAAELKLRPGQFRWFEDPAMVPASTAKTAGVSVVVSLAEQRAYVFRADKLMGVTTVSTGKPGHDTPSGEFTILEKKEFHRSNLYSDAPMPFMQRLTWDGIALHAGDLPGRPASHGCIRLPKTFARQLFDLTAKGGTVTIVEDTFGDPGLYAPTPILSARTEGLGGSAYDVLTLSGDPPAPEPAAWTPGARAD